MKICVMGTGYVGLVTAAGLAEFGHRVIGTDKDAAKIERCARGELGLNHVAQRGNKLVPRATGRQVIADDIARRGDVS